MIKSAFTTLLLVTGITAILTSIVRSGGSITAALFVLVGYATAPFRLVSSLIAGLGSGLSFRDWATIELSLWRDRRRGLLVSRSDYFRHQRRLADAQPVLLIEFSDGRPSIVVTGGSTQGDKSRYLSGASLSDLLDSGS